MPGILPCAAAERTHMPLGVRSAELSETGLVAANEWCLDHEVQVVVRAGDERVTFTRLHDQHVAHAEVDLLPGDFRDAGATSNQVDLVHQVMTMGIIDPAISPAHGNG